jgi:putative FmdB family regulatory protein
MPTYEYTCRDCGHTFEIVQSMLDEPLTMCPECGGSLRKVFAPPAISFKGSGFYSTDHGKKAKTHGESKETREKTGERSGEKSGEKSEKRSGDETGSTGSRDSSTGTSADEPSKSTRKEPAAS